jgi:hypothetical protein
MSIKGGREANFEILCPRCNFQTIVTWGIKPRHFDRWRVDWLRRQSALIFFNNF